MGREGQRNIITYLWPYLHREVFMRYVAQLFDYIRGPKILLHGTAKVIIMDVANDFIIRNGPKFLLYGLPNDFIIWVANDIIIRRG